MDSVYIGFSKPKNKRFPIFSWIIRAMDRTPYSHVYISWYSASIDREIIYEAGGSMVHFVGSKRFEEEAEVLYKFEIPCSDNAKIEIIKFAVDNAEIPYGISQVLGIGIVRFCSLFGVILDKNPLANEIKDEVCSELGGRVLQLLGITIDKDLDIVTPKDIFNAIENLPNVKQIS